MKDNRPSELDHLLRSLPRARASAGFRERVLEAVRQAEAAPAVDRVRWRPYALAAAAAVLVLGLSLGLFLLEQARQAELRREIAELRREHRNLGAEVARLRQVAVGQLAGRKGQEESRRVIFLGGDDRADYVLDLERLARQEAQGQIIPAAEPSVPYTGGAL